MADSVSQQLSSLPHLSKHALCELWQQLFRTPPPCQIRKGLMILILAYRIQEQAFGSLKATTLQRLRKLAAAFENNPNAPISRQPTLKPGTRLVRQWRDKVHLVNVQSNGYEYQGARYRSLSEIAGLITGTHRSGLVFFGIKSVQSSGESKEAQ